MKNEQEAFSNRLLKYGASQTKPYRDIHDKQSLVSHVKRVWSSGRRRRIRNSQLLNKGMYELCLLSTVLGLNKTNNDTHEQKLIFNLNINSERAFIPNARYNNIR